MPPNVLHIGLDDTDSTRKGCTTYVAALLVEELEKLGAHFIDYPNLIRLNPNVPWKTRGNGALCLRISYDKNMEEKVKSTTLDVVEEHSDLDCARTDPGIVFFKKTSIPAQLRTFAKRAITGVVKLKEALKLLSQFETEALGFKNGRGIIGALAAVGETLQEDYTYEILAYRTPENCGTKRRVNEASIFRMDKETAPYTFNNLDNEKDRVVITPRGPDPILYGIRGETPEIVKKAFTIVEPLELVERWVIFRTNQGTDAHLKRITTLDQMTAYSSIIAKGDVSANPRIVPRRHVIFSINDETAEVDCAAYEPTGNLRLAAQKLTIGDEVEVYGAAKGSFQSRPFTINLEKIRVLKLARKVAFQNPRCPNCGKRLKSMGKNQGFRCEKCGLKSRNISKIETTLNRDIQEDFYVTSTRSQRHLTKPLIRYGMEKPQGPEEGMIEGWHS